MIGFGDYTKAVEATIITTLKDHRLVKIDPQEEGFFELVLNFNTNNNDINDFIDAVAEVKDAKLEIFYKPIFDPYIVGTDRISFQQGKIPATGHSYEWWVETAQKMPAVECRKWHLATEYQYYAFLVWLINQMVKQGKSIKKALYQVVIDSRELGHYYNSENSLKGKNFEKTGERPVCGVYDLGNANKILACSKGELESFWITGGNYNTSSENNSLANIYCLPTKMSYANYSNIGFLVL